ncbi:ZIP family metal transporter [Halostagnicola bangensis]
MPANALSTPLTVLVTAFAVGLGLVHLFVGKLEFLDRVPRSRWLSFAGGVSIAYVFVHIIPEIHNAVVTLEGWDPVAIFAEQHVYLIVLFGFVVFYGLEQYVRRGNAEAREHGLKPSAGIFWIHAGSFAVYNALIGYLLVHQEEPGIVGLSTFALAMALHFVVNDFGLRAHHGRLYHDYGRWLLSAAVLVGFGAGYTLEITEQLVSVLFAFLAGGIILNVIKEELPAERESRFWAFALGAAGYAAVLLFV